MEALKQPTIRVIAIIAEGVPEADAKRLIAYARANNKVQSSSFCDFSKKFRQPASCCSDSVPILFVVVKYSTIL